MNNEINFDSDKSVYEYVRKYDISKIPTLNSIFSKYEFGTIQIDVLLKKSTSEDNILIIDARSEKEYEETSISGSYNFPVLKNRERQWVGLIYKNYSNLAAVKLAMEFSEPKNKLLVDFLNYHNAKEKNIFVYCWRGGGRSKYLSKMIEDIGYKVSILEGGIKSFRRKSFEYFNEKVFPYSLIEISGKTGTGKTEVLQELSNTKPIVDLEKAARHFSSLFGYIPYKIRNIEAVKNQSAFENNLYSQILASVYKDNFPGYFLIESESKKVGNFIVPDTLYNKMEIAPTILCECSMEYRVKRIVKDYFGNDNIGLTEIKKIFLEKQIYFTKELSKKLFLHLLSLLEQGESEEFSRIMLNDFYDKKYKVKPKTPSFSVNSENITKAAKEISNYLIAEFHSKLIK